MGGREKGEKKRYVALSFARVIYKNRIHGARRDTPTSSVEQWETRKGEEKTQGSISEGLRIEIKLVAERHDATCFSIHNPTTSHIAVGRRCIRCARITTCIRQEWVKLFSLSDKSSPTSSRLTQCNDRSTYWSANRRVPGIPSLLLRSICSKRITDRLRQVLPRSIYIHESCSNYYVIFQPAFYDTIYICIYARDTSFAKYVRVVFYSVYMTRAAPNLL